MAYVHDPMGTAQDHMNTESLVTGPVALPHWEAEVRGLIAAHVAETGSLHGATILADWATERHNFLQVCPKEMLAHLAHPLSDQAQKVPAE
jgi:glutamate synthase (NADPH) large chain